jgi:hypothetical protein
LCVVASAKFSAKENFTVAQQKVLAMATGGEDHNISVHERQRYEV